VLILEWNGDERRVGCSESVTSVGRGVGSAATAHGCFVCWEPWCGGVWNQGRLAGRRS
jgi:hypothetical protein